MRGTPANPETCQTTVVHSAGRLRRLLPLAYCLAFLAQALGLIGWTGMSVRQSGSIWVTVVAICLMVVVWRRRIRDGGVVHVLLCTAAFGGLGMLAGGIIDGTGRDLGYCCCAGGDPFSAAGWRMTFTGLASGSALGMFAFCIPSCWWVCRTAPSACPARAGWPYHLATHLAMWTGMVWGGGGLAALVNRPDSIPVAHAAMVAGMTGGTLAGHCLWRLADHLSGRIMATADKQSPRVRDIHIK